MERPSQKEQLKIWTYVAAHSFGGPLGQIAVIHKIIVEDRKLISEERFLHALNFCMLLPGPEAQQLATYMGWLMNKWRGGLLAGGLFILPGFLSILLLSYLYVIYNNVLFVQGLFYGVKPAIVAIVLSALVSLSIRSLQSGFFWTLAALSFISLFFLKISFPLVIVFSALLGMIYGLFFVHPSERFDQKTLERPKFSLALKTIGIWLVVWLAPILLTFVVFGKDSTLHSMNVFFSKMSMVSFGGAYAALNYVAQEAVESYGWLQGSEMLDGLAMAETTPGPLIQTVQFVGFMGAYRFPDLASPFLSAFLGSVLATWMTFAPCFLWIFTFAPYVEFIAHQRVLGETLKSITASVVGVIFNLSLWFTFKALFRESQHVDFFFLDFDYPSPISIDLYATGICVFSLFLRFKLKKGLFYILTSSIILGIIAKYVF